MKTITTQLGSNFDNLRILVAVFCFIFFGYLTISDYLKEEKISLYYVCLTLGSVFVLYEKFR
jgi:hypothetical protein